MRHQYARYTIERRIIAWPYAVKVGLDVVGRCLVGTHEGDEKARTPEEAFAPEIERDKNGEEQIQRRPEDGVAEKGYHKIKHRVVPLRVDVIPCSMVPAVDDMPQIVSHTSF